MFTKVILKNGNEGTLAIVNDFMLGEILILHQSQIEEFPGCTPSMQFLKKPYKCVNLDAKYNSEYFKQQLIEI